MTDKRTQEQAEESNTIKNPDDWTTGDEPMTGAQRSYLKTLSEEAKVEFNENLTKAEASKRIDELQAQTGRGQNSQQAGA
jgi:type III secretory pathway component EscR